MSNKVWATWKDAADGEQVNDAADLKEDDSNIDDLRQASVAQQALSVLPATVKVRETKNGEMLWADQKLTDHFVFASGLKAAAGPRRSMDSAPFCALPIATHATTRCQIIASTDVCFACCNQRSGNITENLTQSLGERINVNKWQQAL